MSAIGTLGAFDLVAATYLLNYASTRDELRRLCAVAFDNLAPGGRLIGVNDYTVDAARGTRDFASHSFRKIGPATDDEGTPITYEFLLPDQRSFSITNYYWHPDTYLRVLRDVGFRDAAWHLFEVAPDATSYTPDFWNDLRRSAPCAAFSARR